MPITLPCTCGKTLKMKDELAGKRIKCPACASVLTVPEPDAAEVDLEPVDAAPIPPPPPVKRARPNVEDEEEPVKPKKKKKKKKKKSKFDELNERNRQEEEYEEELRRKQMLQHTIASWCYIVLGVIITICAFYAFIVYRAELLTELTYGLVIVLAFVIGLGAVVKGVLGVISGVASLREED